MQNLILIKIRRYRNTYEKSISNISSKMKLIELIELKKRLENELFLFNNMMNNCYIRDYQYVNIIKDNLEIVKYNENYVDYYDFILQKFINAKNNEDIMYVENVNIPNDIQSTYCIALINKINTYESQKCNTTNIIKSHIHNVKYTINSLERIIKTKK